MSLQTPWGYTLPDADALPALLTPFQYNGLSNYRFESNDGIRPAIDAATSAVRSYAGWHLGPELVCEAVFDSIDTGQILQLPARYVGSIESVTVGGQALGADDWALKPNGLLILRRRVTRDDWGDIVVRYTAGLPESLLGDIRELIANRVTHGLTQSYGVQSEATGGVSVTYNATWANSAQSSFLPESARDVLAPYRLQGVH